MLNSCFRLMRVFQYVVLMFFMSRAAPRGGALAPPSLPRSTREIHPDPRSFLGGGGWPYPIRWSFHVSQLSHVLHTHTYHTTLNVREWLLRSSCPHCWRVGPQSYFCSIALSDHTYLPIKHQRDLSLLNVSIDSRSRAYYLIVGKDHTV